MTDVLVPGRRDVRGVLEEPDDDADAIVVACPPHPQHGGSRSDRRLVAVEETLREAGIACLRFDYGAWDGGHGEREDVRNAIRWADDRYDRVGVFGFSFGASLAILATATVDRAVAAVAALAPTAQLDDDLDVCEALPVLECPVTVLYGKRDTTADWEPVVDLARDRDDGVVALSADHFFVGQHGTVADAVGDFFERTLLPSA
ncbi:alpha/beta hydrolase [Halopiger djelfimassiliensis]|uniref:alpha/beta hydrolase n=1 Tax=Halopiger djelfimassiliensis TaxID=1293047 RepID=UPI0006779DB4|nr:CocE/NonD family hydrolase [Halopiger djelfimassiliensis]